MNYLESNKKLGSVTPNIAQMLKQNAVKFADKIVFAEKVNNVYTGIKWNIFYKNILTLSSSLKKLGFAKGDKMIFYSPNRLEMLQLELAVMASGGISVPIFAFFNTDTAKLLIKHSDAKFVALAGSIQLNNISSIPDLKNIIVFDEIDLTAYKRNTTLTAFKELLKGENNTKDELLTNASPDEICLNMYTSGTMGIPKCVQLTHQNILSQQAAMKQLWSVDENDRFLSYLPWHHSFGGIYELFAVLCNGATMYLESGYGKDAAVILENWKLVKPTIYFSVPRVYQSIYELFKTNPEAEKTFFHPGLKFVFTAAAPMPEKLSNEFGKRKVLIYEGWGLTETSPCSTVTNPHEKRETGVVGKPIPGVSIRIASDGEIQVKGPNVMKGYYKNDEANNGAFTDDGWFRTGDIGEITSGGLKLIARKDRIFKLSNGEKVIPTDMETLIHGKCHYIAFAMVEGSGKEYPVALLFPNKKLFENPDYEISPIEGCFCPRSPEELAKCLRGCLNDANCAIGQKFSKIKSAVLIDDELSLEKGTLTPSMKAAVKNVVTMYKEQLENLYENNPVQNEKVFVIKLDDKYPGRIMQLDKVS
jgi:long-subunit acyl-CoA synthetase (AMP-forming)